MSPVGTVAGVLQLITTLEPLAIPVAEGLVALFRKHPSLTPDQWMTLLGQMVSEIHSENAATLALIAADQAAKP